MHLIDIGANLTHDSFDRDRDAVLDRARQAGVVQMVITGASREHSPLACSWRSSTRASCTPPPACTRTTRWNTPRNAMLKCARCMPTPKWWR